MNGQVVYSTALALCLANGLAAEPCVSSTFDTPLLGATNVVTRHVDVPSPQFPGIWQEGLLSGFSYALFANGEGIVKSAQAPSDWEIGILCQTEAMACTATEKGTVPPDAKRVSDALQQCLLGKDASDQALEEPEAELITEADVPCGVETIAQGAPGFTLQRLLVAAGQDPGPIDGLPGAKTRAAAISILGEQVDGMDTQATIDALNALMCREGN